MARPRACGEIAEAALEPEQLTQTLDVPASQRQFTEPRAHGPSIPPARGIWNLLVDRVLLRHGLKAVTSILNAGSSSTRYSVFRPAR